MRETILKKNYAKAFKTVVLLAVLLAVVSAVSIPLSLSRQIGDLSNLEQAVQADGEYDLNHMNREEVWKDQVTPLSAANFAVIGGLAVLWLALGIYDWLLVAAWLYKSAVNEGMNRSLWPILGLFINLLAVLLFLIVRDDPRRAKAAKA